MPLGSNAGTGVGSAFELTFWQSVAGSDDRSQLEAYLAQYPGGTFSALARAKIAAIDRRDAQARGVAPAAAAVPVAEAPPFPAAQVATAPAAAPLASVPPVSAAPASIGAPPTPAPSLGEQLHALGQSQSQGPVASSAAAAASQTAALPARPQLDSPPDVTLPDHFCSAIERNSFYDAVFTPSKAVAERNNRAAIDHMGKLRQIYDDLSKSSNAPAMNVVADEAKAYQVIATQAYDGSAAYEQLFTRMMAVPIRKCS